MTDIRKIRRLKDYSQEYMAYQLEITQKAYSDLENGKVRMKLKTMKKLSEILDVPLNTLCPISCHCEVELGSVITKLVKVLKKTSNSCSTRDYRLFRRKRYNLEEKLLVLCQPLD